MDMPEIDPNFEPQTRARSNTWPVRPRDLAEEEAARTPSSNEEDRDTIVDIKQEKPFSSPEYGGGVNAKKAGGSRRNAWGNLSYADLITKAIQSSPDCRLTLSQIYEWMVHNVPYFRDKGDSNSSAGWKNSIRHNLSLHSRFMRVQNEGTGKSSWWVINPDAKAGKTPRRRATSMDTKTYEKKRGRVKKKVEALRAAMAGDNLSETGSYGGSAQELNFNDQFSLSPQDFRQRTSSNASSMGRLSPISQSMLEPDMHDNQVPPAPPSSVSPLPWSLNSSPRYDAYNTGTQDQSLSESLADMFVADIDIQDPMVTTSTSMNSPMHSHNQQQQLSPNYGHQGQQGHQQGHRSPSYLPPPYTDQLRRSPQPQQQQSQPMMASQGQYIPQSLTELLSSEGSPNFPEGFLTQVDQIMASPPQGSMLGHYQGNCFPAPPSSQASTQQQTQQLAAQAVAQQRANNSLLRQALTSSHCPPINVKHQHQQHQHQNNRQHFGQSNNYSGGVQQDSNLQLLTGGTMQQQRPPVPHSQPHASFQQQQQNSNSGGSLPSDLDMTDFATEFSGSCDVDQILKHELAFDESLDFNFDASQANAASRETTNTNAAAAAAAAAIAAGKFNNIVQT